MMTKEEARQVCTDAVEAWGIEPQVNIAIEEAAELTVALEHFRRGRATMKEVQTEIADVLICCLQLSLIFGEDGVDSEFQSKLERLKGRIERSKQNISKKEYYGG
jgi:NTP pyrophosphatase (non-canonical NTP hydrolase)